MSDRPQKVKIASIDVSFMDLLVLFLKAGLALVSALVILAVLFGSWLAIWPNSPIPF